MKVKVIKIAKYPYQNPKNGLDFEYVCKILNQTKNPRSLKPESISVKNTPIVYASSLARSKSCIKKIKGQKIIYTNALNEIPFEANEFIRDDSYIKYGSKSIRNTFIKAFIEDRLLMKREEIFKEIKLLLKEVKSNGRSRIGFVSHSFKMKVLQAYIETKGSVIKKPQLIKKYIKPNEKTFDFCTGFDFEL